MQEGTDKELFEKLNSCKLSVKEIAEKIVEGFGDEVVALEKPVKDRDEAKRLRATILSLGYDVVMLKDKIRALIPEYEGKVLDVLQGMGWKMAQ